MNIYIYTGYTYTLVLLLRFLYFPVHWSIIRLKNVAYDFFYWLGGSFTAACQNNRINKFQNNWIKYHENTTFHHLCFPSNSDILLEQLLQWGCFANIGACTKGKWPLVKNQLHSTILKNIHDLHGMGVWSIT